MNAAERAAAEVRLAEYRQRLALVKARRSRNWKTEARRLGAAIESLEALLGAPH